MNGAALLLDAAQDGFEVAALIEDGVLQDFLLRAPDAAPHRPEALFVGKIARRLGRGGAFVDLGGGESGFLAEPGDAREGGGSVYEIRGPAEHGKAWPLTDRVSLRSRRLALTPGAPGLNLARAIADPGRREAVRAALEHGLAEAGAQIGCVARSAAGADPDGLSEEAAWIAGRWRRIAGAGAKPGLRSAAPGPIGYGLREWIAVKGRRPTIQATARSAGAALETALADVIAPSDPIRAQIQIAERGLIERFDLASAALALFEPRQDLGRGAWASLEPTAALAAFDVNTGDAVSALEADLAAAAALPRLLRGRGLGGLIAADFIVKAGADRRRVEEALARGFRGDPAKSEILGWTSGGVLEIRRRKTRAPLDPAEVRAWAQTTPGW